MAARERKREREDRRIAPDGTKRERRPIATDGPATGQKQARGKAPSGILAAQPGSGSGHGPNANVTAKKPPQPQKPRPARDERTPGQKRQAAGYKPSKTLDEALSAVSPKSQPQSEQELAFQRWMAEERRIQAQQGYGGALEGDTVMDATARLLSTKHEDRRAGPDGLERGRKREGRPIATDGPATGQKQARGKAPSGILAAQPGSGSGHGPNASVTSKRKDRPKAAKPASPQKPAPAKAQKPKPAAPAPKPEKRGLFGKKPQSQDSLEERRAKIREQAKTRRARGPVEVPKSGSQLDSTEHASLMKPYYLNDD